MGWYYIETDYGCGIREARNIDHAQRNLLKEIGTHSAKRLCRKATQTDIEWVKGMGGAIPDKEAP